jgi:L-alanine-DL-glutamate epimerase-like enolase superfamily enzyme
MIRSIEVIPLRLPVAQELTISRGSVGSPATGAIHILVKATNEKDTVGWGEARPSPRWSYETPESVVTTIAKYLAPAIVGMNEYHLGEVHRKMNTVIAPGVQIGQPIAKSAIDIALHDLVCKERSISLRAYLCSTDVQEIKLGFVISAATVEEAVRQAEEGMARGYHGFKIKTGIHPSIDLEMVEEVARIGRGKYIWVDANQGWDVGTTLELSRKMAKFGVNVLEQPFAANDITGYQKAVAHSDIPIALDESIYTPTDLVQFVKLKAIGGLVLKVCRVGGILPSKEIYTIARNEGLPLLGSGLTEGRISLTSSCHVFTAAGIQVPVDLNGPQFLADDMVKGKLEYPDEVVRLSNAPGLGVEPDEAKIERYRINFKDVFEG